MTSLGCNVLNKLLIGLCIIGIAWPLFGAVPDNDHAVILVYHHVSESTPASTSVTPDIFESHLDYLERNNYNVISLTEVAEALRDRRPLPNRSVAITFDDGYESILSEAMPRIAKRKWPFTVFVSTAAIDHNYAGFMSWEDLRQIETMGGTIANHSVTHDHLLRRQTLESNTAWRARISDDIQTAQAKLENELDHPARLFAWPYGEFDADLEKLAADLSYIAFGQQSGAAGRASGLQQLPRFPISAAFSDLESFAQKLRSRPLRVTPTHHEDRVLPVPARPPQLDLHIPDGPYRLAELRCYVAGQEPAEITWNGNIVSVIAQQPLPPGRGKFNCTAPSAAENGVFYWYSPVSYQPNDDGTW